MKFIVDKVAVHPPHALTRAEVEALLAVVPENWDLPFSTVHLKATMPGSAGYGNTVTYDISGEGTLTICSRGILPGGIRRDVLRELAILGLHIPPRNGRRIPQAETAEIDTIISPMIDQLNALAPNVTRSPARYSDSFNLVYGALLTHGYPWSEASAVVRAVEAERRRPTSRKKANRIKRAEDILREVGVDPKTMEVLP